MASSCSAINEMDSPSEVIHLILRGRRPLPLVRDEEDWAAVAAIARRMLFWCGGSVHACRCEGPEMRFAIQREHASVGAMAQHISGAYAIHLRRRHGWSGSIFNHYRATPVDADLFLDDLVIWLHRPPEPSKPGQTAMNSCWTADSAYLVPNSSTWIATERVLAALNRGGAGRSVYRRRKTQPITAEVVAILTGRVPRRSRLAQIVDAAGNAALHGRIVECPDIEKIARFVAEYSRISYEEMRSASRRRVIVKAKVVAAVLATRNGASVAAVARLFGRSRSTLIERADLYRATQPELFAHAERAFGAFFQEEHSRRDDSSLRLAHTHFQGQCAEAGRGAPAYADAGVHRVEGTRYPVSSLGKR
jgi:Bacterial dnaA protein helix-turn-helix